MKHVLTIAGSDSCAGAGIQADLKTFAALGVYGLSALTAVTAQNTRGVRAVHDVPPETVRAQLDALAEDIRIDAVKIGMLSRPETIAEVAAFLRRYRSAFTVLDPVMVSKSGHALLTSEAAESLAVDLLPLSDLVTPNIPEAEALVGFSVGSIEAMERAGRALLDRGAKAVLVKGGHLEGVEAVDVLVYRVASAAATTGNRDRAEGFGAGGDARAQEGEGRGEGNRVQAREADVLVRFFRGPKVAAKNTHGTGCTLSSAIAALVARGSGLEEAVGRAKDYVRRGMEAGLEIGSGHGPLNHFAGMGFLKEAAL